MTSRPTLLIAVTPALVNAVAGPLRAAGLNVLVHGQDAYAPEQIDYALSFRPPRGLLKSLGNLKAILSLGAGVDGFFADPELPTHLPLVRFVDDTLSQEMAQYVVMQVLLHHREQRMYDGAQREHRWAQQLLPRRTEDTRVGILGLGEIGMVCARHLRALGFTLTGWSRSTKTVDGVKSFAGTEQLDAFLAQSDVLVCLLPLTPDTRGILNAVTFAKLPKNAFVINVARGGHLIEDDLIAAIDSGHLSGAALDVFQTEPLPASSPLWAHPKITVTPHIAAISDPAAGIQYVLRTIAIIERGETPDHIVDLSRGY
ncbi:MAG TPA: glyoxylate/hydroxypyruvate reductase A [Rhizomicrobium sp.]|jgi:glyoxylate/hydroxypyruvate reductase A